MAGSKTKYVFPREILEHTAQVHYFTHNTKSHLLYTILLIFIAGVLASLPLLKVEVYSSARGMIRPAKEREVLTVINSGRIVYSRLANNNNVTAGDTLLIIDNNGVDDQLILCEGQLEETSLFLHDLSQLLDARYFRRKMQFRTEKFRRSYVQFLSELREYRMRNAQAAQEFERYEYLYGKGVISKAEYERSSLESKVNQSEMLQFKRQQLSFWQTEHTRIQETYRELKAQQQQLIKTRSQYVLIAPINGSLINVVEPSSGNLVAAGTRLAEISPDTELLAECYIDPADIGLIAKNLQVVFKFDAYDYNQWGTVGGEIQEIAKDLEYKEGIPVFKVRCRLKGEHLQLRNGVRGTIKKGMTLSAQFLITKRTLWDLLYDKADDWLNPAQSPGAKSQTLTHIL